MNCFLMLGSCKLQIWALAMVLFVLGTLFPLFARAVLVDDTARGEARAGAIGWLESHQNPDGSWGGGETQPLVTAEVLTALAFAGRQSALPEKKAISWLLNRDYINVDYQARAIRALAYAGANVSAQVQELRDLAVGGTGWGLIDGSDINSLDTALALSAIEVGEYGGALFPTGGSWAVSPANPLPAGWETALVEILSRQHWTVDANTLVLVDSGWSGDWVTPMSDSAFSDRIVTAEVLRSIGRLVTRGALMDSNLGWTDANSAKIRWYWAANYLTAASSPITAGTSTLELAMRIVALRFNISPMDPTERDSAGNYPAYWVTQAYTLEGELFEPSRMPTIGVWSTTDPLTNALGLLAVLSNPLIGFADLPGEDPDLDTVVNSLDAFPFDPTESADLDHDGVGDNADPDIDGDGVLNGDDVFPLVAAEWADSDGDGIGDNAETDDDDDGIDDVVELVNGTDPTSADSDQDGVLDGQDACPTVANWQDADGDGLCAPAGGCGGVTGECDACDDPNDPLNPLAALDSIDLDGDGICDNSDDDDDGDNVSDIAELAQATDPRNSNSHPPDLLVTDPNGDFDGDGLTNATELDAASTTNAFVADTDSDGVLDGTELELGTFADDPNSYPDGVVAVFSGISSSDGSETAGGTADDPVSTSSSGVQISVTGGQPTPVVDADNPPDSYQVFEAVPPSYGTCFSDLGVGWAESFCYTEPPPFSDPLSQTPQNLAGYQPQTVLGVDGDGDGLTGVDEIAQGTSLTSVDTDGDGFVDGPDGYIAANGSIFDLNMDGSIDGEQDHGTDPTDASDHPGKPGDVAPLGAPDGVLNIADLLIEMRILADPNLMYTSLVNVNQYLLTKKARDLNGDGAARLDDVLLLQHAVTGGSQ